MKDVGDGDEDAYRGYCCHSHLRNIVGNKNLVVLSITQLPDKGHKKKMATAIEGGDSK